VLSHFYSVLDRIQDPKYWIADSGATAHMTNNDSCMYDTVLCRDITTVANGQQIIATKKGKIEVQADYTDGTTARYTVLDVLYFPDLHCNLFSTSKVCSKGGTVGTQDRTMTVSMNGTTIRFDHVISTGNSCIIGVHFSRVNRNDVANFNMGLAGTKKYIPLRLLHQQLGHPSEQATKMTAYYYSIPYYCTLDTCVACTKAKAVLRAVPKTVPTSRIENN
jgi:hypothetical protein